MLDDLVFHGYSCDLGICFWFCAEMTTDVAKVILYIVVVDEEDKRDNGKESFRYTRSVLQSTLQLMGCKARHAFKACSSTLFF